MSRRHVVRQLSDGRYVCKACAFSSRTVDSATAHALATTQRTQLHTSRTDRA